MMIDEEEPLVLLRDATDVIGQQLLWNGIWRQVIHRSDHWPRRYFLVLSLAGPVWSASTGVGVGVGVGASQSPSAITMVEIRSADRSASWMYVYNSCDRGEAYLAHANDRHRRQCPMRASCVITLLYCCKLIQHPMHAAICT